MVEERNCLLKVTSFQARNSIFIITNENNSFPASTPEYWFSRGGAETIYKQQTFLEARSQNDKKLHVEDVRESGNLIKVEDSEYKLSDLDIHKNESFEELKNVE